jgi:ATP-dependent RNA helicase DDX56/DBP9
MVEAHLVDKKATFASFSHILDPRILRALADAGFARPTLVQAKAIPLALENRDILARARTGSGKTAAYCIPVVQKILSAKSVGGFLPLDLNFVSLNPNPFFFHG